MLPQVMLKSSGFGQASLRTAPKVDGVKPTHRVNAFGMLPTKLTATEYGWAWDQLPEEVHLPQNFRARPLSSWRIMKTMRMQRDMIMNYDDVILLFCA